MRKGLTLDVYQFYLLNYGDWLRLFEAEKDAELIKLDEKDKEKFNPYHFDYKQTQELFKIYEHLLISPEDSLYGAIGRKYYFILKKDEIYKFSLAYFNKSMLL